VVLYLQSVQPHYDWHTQLMSELALGAQGFMMYGAFALAALGAACLIPCFCGRPGSVSLTRALFSILFGVAAVALVVAGVVTLACAPIPHIASVFVAFVALGTAMFITFRQKIFGGFRWFSLAALLFAVIALFLGSADVLAAGTTQRMAALGILGWISVAGVYFSWGMTASDKVLDS